MMMEYRAAENTRRPPRRRNRPSKARPDTRCTYWPTSKRAGDVPDTEEYANERAEIGRIGLLVYRTGITATYPAKRPRSA